MLLKDYNEFINELGEYWETEINSFCYANNIDSSSMLLSLNNYINNLQNEITSYMNNTQVKDVLEDMISIIISYIKIKFDFTFENDPGVPDLIEDNELINLFNAFKYELNTDYSSYFIINEIITTDETTGTESTSYIFETDNLYQNLLTDISSFIDNDISNLESFKSSFPNAIRKKLNYQSLNHPKGFSMGIQPKSHMLIVMKLQDVLDVYNWKIFGLNSDDPND